MLGELLLLERELSQEVVHVRDIVFSVLAWKYRLQGFQTTAQDLDFFEALDVRFEDANLPAVVLSRGQRPQLPTLCRA